MSGASRTGGATSTGRSCAPMPFGAAIAVLALRSVAFVPSKAMVYLILGLIPFVVELLPREHGIRTSNGAACRVLRLCDHRDPAHRRQRRSVPRCVLPEEHARPPRPRSPPRRSAAPSATSRGIVYFGIARRHRRAFPLWAFVPAILLAVAGSVAGAAHARPDDRPRLPPWTRMLIFTVSAVYLIRAAWLFWRSWPVKPTGSPRRCARSTARRAPAACGRCARD